jgi:hypothetical protein
MGITGKRDRGGYLAHSFRTRVAFALFILPGMALWAATTGDPMVDLRFAVPFAAVLWPLGVLLLRRYRMWPFDGQPSTDAPRADPGAAPPVGPSGSYPCSMCGYQLDAGSSKPCPSCGSAPP